ncbi:hypothetical protein BGV53_15760 [Burkholderia ubonensis]|nr:hypothetical protein BGV53_15760 [Burkholderia ubonensis]
MKQSFSSSVILRTSASARRCAALDANVSTLSDALPKSAAPAQALPQNAAASAAADQKVAPMLLSP